MGAQLETRRIDTIDRKEVEKIYGDMWDEAKDYYGSNPYSGSFATLERHVNFRYVTFSSDHEAEKYIADNSDKWGSAVAVVVKDNNGKPHTLIGGWCAS